MPVALQHVCPLTQAAVALNCIVCMRLGCSAVHISMQGADCFAAFTSSTCWLWLACTRREIVQFGASLLFAGAAVHTEQADHDGRTPVRRTPLTNSSSCALISVCNLCMQLYGCQLGLLSVGLDLNFRTQGVCRQGKARPEQWCWSVEVGWAGMLTEHCGRGGFHVRKSKA